MKNTYNFRIQNDLIQSDLKKKKDDSLDQSNQNEQHGYQSLDKIGSGFPTSWPDQKLIATPCGHGLSYHHTNNDPTHMRTSGNHS